MKAMILAAGIGERMQPITFETPKPLIKINEQYLIEYSLYALSKAGFKAVVINIYHHADQIKKALGNGKRYGLNIQYSEEKELLNTGGGIFHALSLLGDEPFLVTSSDIISDYPLRNLPKKISGLAHLVLVDNPPYHPKGDFSLHRDKVSLDNSNKLTFGNIGIYHPQIFKGCTHSPFPLNKVLLKTIERNQVTGEHFQGQWANIGSEVELTRFIKTLVPKFI